MIRENRVKYRLQQGEAVIGTFVRTPAPAVVEVLGLSGLDFVIIDNEHSPLDIESTTNLIRAADLVGLTPIVRVTENRASLILRALDAGALGVQVPQVNTVDEAKAAALAARYEPEGTRGLANSQRAAHYGFMNTREYIEAVNRETMVIAYIETAEGYRNLDAILAVPGIDVYFVGPMDMSQALGYPGQPTHPVIQNAICDAVRRIRDAGHAVGITAAKPEEAQRWLDLGVQYIAYSSDLGFVGAAASQAVAAFRTLAPQPLMTAVVDGRR